MRDAPYIRRRPLRREGYLHRRVLTVALSAGLLAAPCAGAAAAAGPGTAGGKPTPAAAPTTPGTPPAAGPVKPTGTTIPPAAQTENPLYRAMADAATTAKKTHHATTVDAATTPYGTLIANTDGSFTTQQYLEPQRAEVNGVWKPIDTTLSRGSDGALHAKATVVSVTLSDGGSGALATVDDGVGHSLVFTWPGGALPAPTLSGDTATYPNVYPGVDLQMVALPAGVQDLLVVHDAKAATNPALKTVSIGVTGKGLTVSAASDGGVTARDSSGREVFGGPTPQMWDASAAADATANSDGIEGPAPATGTGTANGSAKSATGSPHRALLPATVSGGQVRISPDLSLLATASASNPVTIDPSWTTNAQNWIEMWSNGHTAYDGSPAPYTPYDTSAVRVGNSGGTLVRSLFSFGTGGVPWPGPAWGSGVGGPNSPPLLYIVQANLNLTAQSSVCPATQVWGANPFNTGSNWSNQNGGSDTDLWPASGSGFTNPVATVGGATGCAGRHFTANVTAQMQNVYNSGGSTITIGLRAANESSTTNNYGSYFVQNNANAAYLSVTYTAEPTLGTISVGASWIGNDGKQVNACSTGYLPMQTGPVAVSAPVNDIDPGRTVDYTMYVDGGSGSLTPVSTVAPTTARGQINTMVYTDDANGNPVGSGDGLQDGQTYTVWMQALDGNYMINGTPGPSPYAAQLYSSWTNGGNNYPAPYSTSCTFKAALTPPGQPTFNTTGTTFTPVGQHISGGYPTAGQSDGTVSVTAVAPTTPIDHFDWALNTSSTNEGLGHCGSVPGIACGTVPGFNGTTATATASIPIPAGGQHWGTNYLYVSAVDKAGNVSPYARYDFFLAQQFQPVSFGDVTGDGVPDIMAVDSGGNLVTYPTNVDPAPGADTAVQAAPASAAPNGTNWDNALYTHRGSLRGEPTDDLFALDRGSDGNNHLYYYSNAETLSASVTPGLNPAPINDAFSQTAKSPMNPPACVASAATGWCAGYDGTWNNVVQIAAVGPVSGGCVISSPGRTCRTSLLAVMRDPAGGPSRLWLFPPAGPGSLGSPQLLSVSTPAWQWDKMQLLTPGNAAGHPGGAGGLPDLWVEDPNGSVWQFANTGTPASLGDLGAKTMISSVGEFHPYKWIRVSSDQSGNPDVWAMAPNGQISVLTGSPAAASAAPLSPTQTTATAVNWGSLSGVSSLEGEALPAGVAGPLVSDVKTSGNASRQICLDDSAGGTNDGNTIQIYDCNGTYPQNWQFAADGTVRMSGSNPASPPNKCLDTGNSLLLGARITLDSCSADKYQIWQILPSATNAGEYSLYNPASGLCMDDTNYGTNNSNPIQLWECSSNGSDTAQEFTLPTGPGQTQSFEAESMWNTYSGTAPTVQGNCCGVSWSNGAQLWLSTSALGSSVTLDYFVANAGTYDLSPVMTKSFNYGTVTASIDGSPTPLPNTFDSYNSSVATQQFTFGAVTLAAGPHTFTFTATGKDPASSNYELGIDTLDLVPVASLAAVPTLSVTPASGTGPLTVTASAAGSTGGASAISSYTFDFGDGTVVGPQTSPTATHTYGTVGTVYVVKLTVTDAANRTSTVTAPVSVTAPTGPTAALTVPATATVGTAITADASQSTAGSAAITSYSFDFGDGSSVTQSTATATHAYASAGTYTVTVTVTDTNGLTSLASQSVTVQ